MTSTNCTESNEAARQAQLASALKDYKRLCDNVPTPCHILSPSGVIVSVNKRWCRTLGFSKREALGRSIFEFIAEEEREQARDSFEHKKAGTRTFIRGHERHFRTKAGNLRTFLTMDHISRNREGQVVAVHTTLEDITDREKMEKELRAANMRLSKAMEETKSMQLRMIHNERLNALGQMASGIAHDFNNALMPILGLSKLILDDPTLAGNSRSVKTMITQIHSAAVEAKHIVARLTSFYKSTTSSSREVVDMKQVVAQALALTRPRWQEDMRAKGITVKTRTLLRRTPPVLGNSLELREALINLILNATDAMPHGGTITIRILAETPWVVIKISDTGIGMTEEALRRCFEPFFSTKGDAGSGLGLTMVQNIVRTHGGTIVVESAPSRGTTVTIKLPEAHTATVEPETDSAASRTLPPLRILLIDDDPRSRHVLTEFLIPGNHSVRTAETGREGISVFRRHSFDLVITDHALPDMNGIQVAAAIKKLHPRLPVILLSGMGDILRERGKVSTDIDVGLNKPVTQRDLHLAILTAIDKMNSLEPRGNGGPAKS